jgi:hypothetical protein
MKTNSACVLCVVLAGALVCCGSDGTHDNKSPDGQGTNPTLPGESDASNAQPCPSLPTAVTDALYLSATPVCSGVIRLRTSTIGAVGYQLLCGARAASVDEATARTTAQQDTKVTNSARTLNPTSPTDAFVFYDPPADTGAVAVVSAITGATLFGGTTIWSGTGSVDFPATWRSGDELNVGCGASPTWPAVRGYDLRSGSSLSEADQTQALALAGETALVSAMATLGTLDNVVVLRYPPSTGYAGSEANDEWVVVVTGHGGS